MNQTLTRVVYIQNILSFVCFDVKQLVCLRRFHSSWKDTIENYSTEHWARIFVDYDVLIMLTIPKAHKWIPYSFPSLRINFLVLIQEAIRAKQEELAIKVANGVLSRIKKRDDFPKQLKRFLDEIFYMRAGINIYRVFVMNGIDVKSLISDWYAKHDFYEQLFGNKDCLQLIDFFGLKNLPLVHEWDLHCLIKTRDVHLWQIIKPKISSLHHKSWLNAFEGEDKWRDNPILVDFLSDSNSDVFDRTEVFQHACNYEHWSVLSIFVDHFSKERLADLMVDLKGHIIERQSTLDIILSKSGMFHYLKKRTATDSSFRKQLVSQWNWSFK
jgi:hypothetical protein